MEEIKKKAVLEMISGLIRVYPEEKKYGDRYEYVVTCRTLSKDRVELLGVMTAPTPSQWRAIRECLRSHGVVDAVMTRRRTDGTVERRYLWVRKKE